jgi:hypothetical protein
MLLSTVLQGGVIDILIRVIFIWGGSVHDSERDESQA